MAENTDVTRLSRARQLTRGEGRRMREDALVTQRELASAIDVDAATLQRWEAGATRPRSGAALRWLDTLERLTVRDRSSAVRQENTGA